MDDAREVARSVYQSFHTQYFRLKRMNYAASESPPANTPQMDDVEGCIRACMRLFEADARECEMFLLGFVLASGLRDTMNEMAGQNAFEQLSEHILGEVSWTEETAGAPIMSEAIRWASGRHEAAWNARQAALATGIDADDYEGETAPTREEVSKHCAECGLGDAIDIRDRVLPEAYRDDDGRLLWRPK